MSYTSLKDIYNNHVCLKPIPPLARHGILRENTETIEQIPWPEWIKQNVDFVSTVKGEGNGERMVAALYEPMKPEETKKQYYARLGKLVQGQKVSFDVQTPDGKRFEVKQIPRGSDVRIAKEGNIAEEKIGGEIIGLMNLIADYFQTLDKPGQEELDRFLIQKISNKRVQPAKDWSLETYCADIIKNVANMGKQFLYSPVLKTALRGQRAGIMLMTLDELNNNLIEFCKASQEGTLTGTEMSDERINTNVDKLFKLFQDLYLPKNIDQNDASNKGKELEARAELIDRELTAFKCSMAPGECLTSKWFCTALSKINLPERIQKIRNMLIGPLSLVPTLFPNEVNGLYIVNPNFYEYVPRQEFASKLYIATFAGQGAKVARIADKAAIDSKPEENEENETV